METETEANMELGIGDPDRHLRWPKGLVKRRGLLAGVSFEAIIFGWWVGLVQCEMARAHEYRRQGCESMASVHMETARRYASTARHRYREMLRAATVTAGGGR